MLHLDRGSVTDYCIGIEFNLISSRGVDLRPKIPECTSAQRANGIPKEGKAVSSGYLAGSASTASP